MVNIPADLVANYTAFSTILPTDLVENIVNFQEDERLLLSYARIASLNAIKVDLVKDVFPVGAAQFFYEAHNDALISHVNASYGSWRPALQSLRSFMENTLSAIYFLDHPVEFARWEQGTFRIAPRELRAYVGEHPKLELIAGPLNVKGTLDNEYSTLSKAVHASNSLFRMTNADGKINIAKPSIPELGKWSKREKEAFDICLVVLIGVLQEHLDGAKLSQLRSSLSFALGPKSRSALKTHYSISIPEPK